MTKTAPGSCLPANACTSQITIIFSVGRRTVMTETFLGGVNVNV